MRLAKDLVMRRRRELEEQRQAAKAESKPARPAESEDTVTDTCEPIETALRRELANMIVDPLPEAWADHCRKRVLEILLSVGGDDGIAQAEAYIAEQCDALRLIDGQPQLRYVPGEGMAMAG